MMQIKHTQGHCWHVFPHDETKRYCCWCGKTDERRFIDVHDRHGTYLPPYDRFHDIWPFEDDECPVRINKLTGRTASGV